MNIFVQSIRKSLRSLDYIVKKSNLASVLLLFILICSCGDHSETPIQLTERMKTLACAGDIEGFYSYVDKLSVEKNLKKIALEKIRENIAGKGQIKNTDPNAVRELKEIVIPSLIVLKWEVMNRELELGEAGSFCNMKVHSETEDNNTINLEFPDGKNSTWGFEKRSGKLILVSILDKDPFDFIDENWGLKSLAVGSNKDELIAQRSDKEDIDNVNPTQMPRLLEADRDVMPDWANEESVQVEENTVHDNDFVIVEKGSGHDIEPPDRSARDEGRNSTVQISYASYDFGRARWGMTKEQVVSAQGSEPLLEKGDMLKFNGIYQGMGAELTYVFSGNGLVKGIYRLNGNGDDGMLYMRNYLRIKELLSLRYGEPQSDQEIWANSIYKDKPDRYGFAVFIGHLSYKTKWTTNRTDVLLELKSGNYDMLLEALYYSK